MSIEDSDSDEAQRSKRIWDPNNEVDETAYCKQMQLSIYLKRIHNGLLHQAIGELYQELQYLHCPVDAICSRNWEPCGASISADSETVRECSHPNTNNCETETCQSSKEEDLNEGRNVKGRG